MRLVLLPPLLLALSALPACKGSETQDSPAAPPTAPAVGEEAQAAVPEHQGAAAPHAAVAEEELLDADSGMPNLVVLMRRMGYPDAGTASLDDFVHLPPDAQGQAGSFGQGATRARVVLIKYPNAHHAAPHVGDVEERNRVLPNPREAVAAWDSFVLHVVASDQATAQDLASRLAAELGWSQQ